MGLCQRVKLIGMYHHATSRHVKQRISLCAQRVGRWGSERINQCTGVTSACVSDRDNCIVLANVFIMRMIRILTVFVFGAWICGGTGASYNTKIKVLIARRVFSTGF